MHYFYAIMYRMLQASHHDATTTNQAKIPLRIDEGIMGKPLLAKRHNYFETPSTYPAKWLSWPVSLTRGKNCKNIHAYVAKFYQFLQAEVITAEVKTSSGLLPPYFFRRNNPCISYHLFILGK